MLSLLDFGDDTGASALSFKSAKSAVKRFVFFHSDFSHYNPSLRIKKVPEKRIFSAVIIHRMRDICQVKFENLSEKRQSFSEKGLAAWPLSAYNAVKNTESCRTTDDAYVKDAVVIPFGHERRGKRSEWRML